jgi:hypothetical protein
MRSRTISTGTYLSERGRNASDLTPAHRRANRRGLLISFFMMLILITGCNFPSKSIQPTVSPIPTSTSTPALGEIGGKVWNDLCDPSLGESLMSNQCIFDSKLNLFIANGVIDYGESGISGLEVTLGIGICPSKGLASVITAPDGSYRFSDLQAGDYCIMVNTGASHALASLESGIWTYPKADGGQGVGWMSISLGEGEVMQAMNFGWASLRQAVEPKSEPTDTPTETAACENRVKFIKDVTISDGAWIKPEEGFQKVWRLKNDGTCTWTKSYSIVFENGDRMGAPESLPLLQEVLPGETIDLAIDFVSPEPDGRYKGYWMLSDEKGERFGLGENADKPFWVQIVVGSKPTRDSVVSWQYSLDPGELEYEGRWIDVSLGEQRLTAYEGAQPVATFLISSGTASYPTVTGQFRIWVKLESTDMKGPGYDLKDVPHTMYFYEGYGLHGAYWHNNFGAPMSHGCINLGLSDAAWLYDFASVGTLVNIHP